MWKKVRAILAQAAMTAAAAQCGGSDGKIFVPGGDQDATLNVSVTDAPVDTVTAVGVNFTGIELTPSSGSKVTINLTSQQVNLLSLTDGATTALTTNQKIDAGTYTAIRFILSTSTSQDSSYVDLPDGSRFPLVIPNNGDNGLTITKNFTVASSGRLDLVADFDLRRSIAPRTGSSYSFTPSVRVVDSSQSGNIAGNIDTSLITTNCTPFVYVFSGSAAATSDINGTAGPIVSVPVKLNVASSTYSYRVSFLDPGTYTLALTCNGSIDNPNSSEAVVFSRSGDAVVTANQTKKIDFTS
jgi:hypothetical protein